MHLLLFFLSEPTSQQNQLPNKRRKKDQTKGQSGSDDGCNPNKPAKVGKKAGKSVPHAAGTSSPSYGVVMPTLYRENANVQNQVSACMLIQRIHGMHFLQES